MAGKPLHQASQRSFLRDLESMFLHNLTVIPPLTLSLCHSRICSNYRFAVSTVSPSLPLSLSFPLLVFFIVYFRTGIEKPRIEISLVLPKIFYRENRIPMISNLSFSNTSCDRIVTIIYRYRKVGVVGMAAPRRAASNSFQLAAGWRERRGEVAVTMSKKYVKSCAMHRTVGYVQNYTDKDTLKKGEISKGNCESE